MTQIIVDSICDLPKNTYEQYNIDMLPLRVFIDDVEYLDKKTITTNEVYKEMKLGKLPKTSQPRLIDIYELFNRHASKGQNFIYIAFSAVLSGTYQTAYRAIEELRVKYPDVKMEIIDSKAGASGIGLLAAQAAKLSAKGYSFEEIHEEIETQVNTVEHIFTLSDLMWLSKGGRLSKGAAAVGEVLSIRPLLHIKDGKLEVFKKVRGNKKALSTLMDVVEERIAQFPDQEIYINYAEEMETAFKIRDTIIERFGDRPIHLEPIGSVLGSHLGLSGIGVIFYNQKPKLYID